jgi:hypothetical protein
MYIRYPLLNFAEDLQKKPMILLQFEPPHMSDHWGTSRYAQLAADLVARHRILKRKQIDSAVKNLKATVRFPGIAKQQRSRNLGSR